MPLHVSYGPENKREIVLMLPKDDSRIVLKVVKSDVFLTFLRNLTAPHIKLT